MIATATTTDIVFTIFIGIAFTIFAIKGMSSEEGK